MPPRLPEGGKTLVYFTVDGHDVKLDYYLPPNASGNLPAIIYYHGGGMTAGSRRGMGFPHWLYSTSFHLISQIPNQTSKISNTVSRPLPTKELHLHLRRLPSLPPHHSARSN